MHKKISSEIAVGIILLFVVIFGIIFWMQSNDIVINTQLPIIDNKKPIQKETVACTQEVKHCPDGMYISRTGPNCEFALCPGEKDDNSVWQTYNNEKYGFEFKYPNDWKIVISKDPDQVYQNNLNPPSFYECLKNIKEVGSPCGSVYFGIATNFEKLGIEDYLKNEMGWNFEGAYKDLKKININGNVAYKLTAISGYDGNESLQFWIPLSGGNFFEISTAYLNAQEVVIFEKIANTFK
jgi:hypothetical protein